MGTVITVLTVDEALQHVCAVFREHADRGDITPAERDLLIDGAILLAMRVDDLAPGWPRRPGLRLAGGAGTGRAARTIRGRGSCLN